MSCGRPQENAQEIILMKICYLILFNELERQEVTI